MPRLGTLREFDFDHFDLRRCRLGRKLFGAERPIAVAATKIAAAELPYQVAAELPMVAADRAFAGIVRKAAKLGAFVEGTDRVRTERSKAHRRNVQQRNFVWLPALVPADADAKRVPAARARRE